MSVRVASALTLGALLLAAPSLRAQAVRMSGTTSVRYVELRPIQRDSVPVLGTVGDGSLRTDPDGRAVQCVEGAEFCYYYGSAGVASTLPAMQDLTVSAWGFGRGVRLYAHLRGRAVVAGESGLWPLADDPFDALEAYAELDRPRFRVRAGRQWEIGGLGFGNYDGASLLLRPLAALRLEAYGGWSLTTGLNEPVTSGALAAVEPFAPDQRGVLLGARVQARPAPALSLSAAYERRIRQDRAGLYSERVATDGMLRGSRASLDWEAQLDVASRETNELRVRGLYSPSPDVTLRAFGRQHRPYFDLWTIWGVFAPVGFREAGVGASWRRADGGLRLDAQGTRRHYLDTDVEAGFAPIRADGWAVRTSASLSLGPDWGLDAQYGIDLGFGAGKSDGGVRLERTLGPGRFVAVRTSAFQTADELRVSHGIVLGLGLEGGLALGARDRIDGSLAAYRHRPGAVEDGPDWSQLRASVSFSWTVGAEPGLGAAGGRP